MNNTFRSKRIKVFDESEVQKIINFANILESRENNRSVFIIHQYSIDHIDYVFYCAHMFDTKYGYISSFNESIIYIDNILYTYNPNDNQRNSFFTDPLNYFKEVS